MNTIQTALISKQAGVQQVWLPEKARIIDCFVADGHVTVSAAVDDSREAAIHEFLLVMDNEEIPIEQYPNLRFIRTVMVPDPAVKHLIYHVFHLTAQPVQQPQLRLTGQQVQAMVEAMADSNRENETPDGSNG